MKKAGSTPVPPHLLAGLIALLSVAAIVAAVPATLAHLGSQALKGLLTAPSMQKDMGTLLQILAMEDNTVLPVYGSSELTRREPNRPDCFFASSPTGFQVCSVGGAGNTSLMTAQKIAALGDHVRDRKLVVLLSCSWFRRPTLPTPHYTGNFSPAQAMNIVLDDPVGPRIRRRLADRMLDFPDTLKEAPALCSCLRGLVSNDALSMSCAAWQRPLLQLQQATMATQDNLGTLLNMMLGLRPAKGAANADISVAVARPFSWDATIGRAAEFAAPEDLELPSGQPHRSGVANETFIEGFENAHEWADFDLLLDTCKTLGARPLIVAIPLDGAFESAHGVSPEARSYYYNRLRDACASRGFTFAHLGDHDMDPGFVINHSSHLSGKGWIFVNRLLDDFYHDRLPATTASSVTHS